MCKRLQLFTATTAEVSEWMSNYIPLFYVYVITYLYPHPHAG